MIKNKALGAVMLGVLSLVFFSGNALAVDFEKSSASAGRGKPSGAPVPAVVYLLGMSAAGGAAYLRRRRGTAEKVAA